jgi:hypothetical protein
MSLEKYQWRLVDDLVMEFNKHWPAHFCLLEVITIDKWAGIGSMLGYQTMWQSIASQKKVQYSECLLQKDRHNDGATFGQRPSGRIIGTE